MDKDKLTPGAFSWLPPRSTVMKISPKSKRRSGRERTIPEESESYTTPPVTWNRPDGNFRAGKVKDQRLAALKLESRERSQSLEDRTRKKGNVRPRSSTYDDSTVSRANETKDISSEFKERHIKPEKKGIQESGDPQHEIQPSDKQNSIFAKKIIGSKAFNVEKVLASRKISEVNPSEKFISLCYQLADQGNAEEYTIDEGAMYARRIPQPENQQDAADNKETQSIGKNSPATKRKNDKKEKAGKVKSKVKKETTSKNDVASDIGDEKEAMSKTRGIQKGENKNGADPRIPSKKTSVFEMKELHEESIDLHELMSRKISKESQNGKFVSISWQHEANGSRSSDGKRDGGLYAKKVRSRTTSS